MSKDLSIVQSQIILENFSTLPYISSLAVTKAGYFPNALGHFIKRDDLDEYILIYCIDGEGFAGSSSPTESIHKGDILLIKNHTPHFYGASESNPWSILWVHFTGSHVDSLLNHFLSDSPYFSTSIGYQPHLVDLFHHLLATFSSDANSFMMLRSTTYFQHLLCEMISLEQLSYKQQTQFKDIRQVIYFMKKNLSHKISLVELAATANLSKYHFSRKFKNYTGHSPLEYFNQLKINKACDLLLTPELTINEISEKLGFSTPYYFPECFKHTIGYSPSQFRLLSKSRY